ncbi:MAG TPA: Fe2+-dependent dioxygenase, partial [Steroidobacteraceae bacterium]|nr:Fe2+-dependent dioxygenase [Steroidobacteraceae bacterium]
MMIHVPKVLTPEQVAECRRLLDPAEWSDGKATVGEQGALVKKNRQLPELSPVGQQLGGLILTALSRNPLFFSAALPLKTVPPLFNRYESGEQYGTHIDGAVRAVPGSSHFIRTDLSSTLFLTDPSEYDGGELVVLDTYGQHEVKLPAGDLILYTSGSLHRVNPVTRGARVCSFFWTQSMVADERYRELLYKLDQTIQKLRGKHGE